jgi:hypothetical protein
MSPYLCIEKRIFRTRDENKAFDFGKVGKLRWVEFSDADRVGLFVGVGYNLTKVCD